MTSTELATTSDIEVLPPQGMLAPLAANPAQSRQQQLEALRLETEFLEIAYGLAEKACNNGGQLVAAHFRNKPADGAIAIAYGSSLGWHWTKSLQDVYVVNGKPCIQSKDIRELLIRAGHLIWEEEVGPKRVVLAGRRRGSDLAIRVEWTIEKAHTAGLTSNKNYDKFPENMLYARCTTDLGKRLAPDALSGLGVVEELQDLAYIESSRPARQPQPARGMNALREAAAASAGAVSGGAFADNIACSEAGGQPYDPDQVSAATDPARRKLLNNMFRLFAAADIAKDNRDDRLIVTRKLVRRAEGGAPITSSDDLTDRELATLVSLLDAAKADGTLGAKVTDVLNAHTIDAEAGAK